MVPATSPPNAYTGSILFPEFNIRQNMGFLNRTVFLILSEIVNFNESAIELKK